MPQRPSRNSGIGLIGWCLIVGCLFFVGGTGISHADTPTLGLDHLQRGMTGYGMSVFTDDKIEPFDIEIVSVVINDKPGVNSIWIRCPGPRMQLTGPVQGMSGSPIYVWPNDVAEVDRIPGQNGKLIGAFAFGYELGKDCYVGVQPIDQMRAVSKRLDTQSDPQVQGTQASPLSSPADGRITIKLLGALNLAARQAGRRPANAWKAQAVERLIQPGHHYANMGSNVGVNVGANVDVSHTGVSRVVPGELPFFADRNSRQIQPMLLPMTGMSSSAVQTMQPLFAALGLSAIGTGQMSVGNAASRGQTAGHLSQAPNGVDLDALKLEPGSILAIPLAWGDVNFTAAGTVTDVLDDGAVLAFGHGMGQDGNGEGPSALPVATGYVHFIQPHLLSSFKMSGVGKIAGSLMRDESSGIVARDEQIFTTADAKITVRLPGQPERVYHAQLVQHRQYTAMLGATMALECLESVQGIPPLSTLHVRYKMTFASSNNGTGNTHNDGDINPDITTTATAMARAPKTRVLEVDTLIPGGTSFDMAYEILPPISVMIDNPYESAMLESLDVTIDVQPVVKTLTMMSVRLDKTEYEPGESVGALLTMMPYGQQEITQRLSLDIPDDLPDGEYNVMLCDAETYAQLVLLSRPHLMQIHDADELLDLVRQFFGVKNTAVYMLMMLPEQGLAVGRTELPRLPSSHRAMIASPTTTAVTWYSDWVTSVTPVDGVPMGQFALIISVRRNPH